MSTSANGLPDLQEQAVDTVPAKLSCCVGVGLNSRRILPLALVGRRRTDGLMLPLGHLRPPRNPKCFA